MGDPVQIPSKAVSDGDNVATPATGLLQEINLLAKTGEESDATGFVSAFTGPPQSVALIEAGATAAAKWWATGLSAAVLPLWGAVAAWWPKQQPGVQEVVVGGALLVTAALVLAAGYLLASDVRGRADASVALIKARATVADEMTRAAQALYAPVAATAPELVPLPSAVRVKNILKEGEIAESGWLAVALERHLDGNKYVVVKGSEEEVVPASALHFEG